MLYDLLERPMDVGKLKHVSPDRCTVESVIPQPIVQLMPGPLLLTFCPCL